MSTKESYTSDEWSLLRSTPTFVAAGVAAADPGGIIGALKEATAGVAAFADFAARHAEVQLFAALAQDTSFPAMPDPRTLLGEGDSAAQSANFQTAVIARARDALAVVAAKGSAAEADGYRQLLLAVAETVANAATEGGFLGFGGVRVSDKEKNFLAALAAALNPAGAAEPVGPN